MISGRVQGQARLKSDLVPRVALQAHLRSNYVPLAAFGPWTNYTPSLFASSGTFTSASAQGRFLQIGKLVFVKIFVAITTNGTAAGFIGVTLPTNVLDECLAYGRENAITGKMLQGISGGPGSNSLAIINYDNTYPGVNGASIAVTGTYEAQ